MNGTPRRGRPPPIFRKQTKRPRPEIIKDTKQTGPARVTVRRTTPAALELPHLCLPACAAACPARPNDHARLSFRQRNTPMSITTASARSKARTNLLVAAARAIFQGVSPYRWEIEARLRKAVGVPP